MRSVRLKRRTLSYSPALTDRRLEELKDELEERFRETKLPGGLLSDLITEECSMSSLSPLTAPMYNTIIQKIDYLSDQIHSACCNLVGDGIIIGVEHQLRIEPNKVEPTERNVDGILKDLQLRRTEVERYSRTFRREGYYTLNQFVAADE